VSKEEFDLVVTQSVPEARPGAIRIKADRPLQHDEIARLAYDLWQARGCPHGSADIDWLQAEKELRVRETGKKPQPAVRPFLTKRAGTLQASPAVVRDRSNAS
jgi:hypothetical protein